MRNKVLGMVIGGAIGDALGGPVETWGQEKIAEVHGGPITRYVAPIGHKWFNPETMPAGSTTDDTQLILAVMEGLIKGRVLAAEEKNFDHYLKSIATQHVLAASQTMAGWGKTTVEAVRRIANGVDWKISGRTVEKHRGTGNGAPMKIAPMAAWWFGKDGQIFESDGNFHFCQRCVEISAMTHYTKISAIAATVHAYVMYYLLTTSPGVIVKKYVYDVWELLEECLDPSIEGDPAHWKIDHLEDTGFDFWKRLREVWDYTYKLPQEERTVQKALEIFGGGSCHVFDSLPFSYALFLRDPFSFQSILDAVNAGGDNDTNAKFVGEMIGALHGIEFFERPENAWSLEGLRDYDRLVSVTNQFCDTFEIE
jgi:ADP-ribosylglycohydrolase